MQEGIIKIPHRWQVGLEAISAAEWLHFTEQFLTYYFPAYPIHLIVAHVDERLKYEDTGTHCHYFLSGQDSNFGNWDILKTQIEVVNQYVQKKNEETGLREKLLPENCVLNRRQMSRHGEHLQSMFRDFINEHFLNERGLHVELAPESERRSEERRRMDKEAKLPKSERSFNYHSRLIEEQEMLLTQLQKKVGQQQDQLRELQTTHRTLSNDIDDKKEELLKLNHKTMVGTEHLQSLINQIGDNRAQLVQQLGQMKQLNEQQQQKIAEILGDAFSAQLLQRTGFSDKAEAYFIRLAETLENDIALELKPLVQKMVHAAIEQPSERANENDDFSY